MYPSVIAIILLAHLVHSATIPPQLEKRDQNVAIGAGGLVVTTVGVLITAVGVFGWTQWKRTSQVDTPLPIELMTLPLHRSSANELTDSSLLRLSTAPLPIELMASPLHHPSSAPLPNDHTDSSLHRPSTATKQFQVVPPQGSCQSPQPLSSPPVPLVSPPLRVRTFPGSMHALPDSTKNNDQQSIGLPRTSTWPVGRA
ncbi:hypothetical protein K440DRAFT_642095 [Wilcoxina mikolae CBS 423.85]|nr:hypothetical protein K440DRAFT_642095 [Wilcoxina mikolae CBS 423.85]